MTPLLAVGLVLVVTFASALLIPQWMAWREQERAERRLRDLPKLPDDWWPTRRDR